MSEILTIQQLAEYSQHEIMTGVRSFALLGAWVQHESSGFYKRLQTNNLALTLSHSGPGGRRFKSSLPDHFDLICL